MQIIGCSIQSFLRAVPTLDKSLLLDIKFHSVRVTLHDKTVQIIHLDTTVMVIKNNIQLTHSKGGREYWLTNPSQTGHLQMLHVWLLPNPLLLWNLPMGEVSSYPALEWKLHIWKRLIILLWILTYWTVNHNQSIKY